MYFLDIEVAPNLFLVVAKNQKSNYKNFIISSWHDDSIMLREWLATLPAIITFNGMGYDYPILHYFMTKITNQSAIEITDMIYNESKRVIAEEFSTIAKWNRKFPVLDLYLLHHFNNKSKHASLKWIEMNLGFWNVQELPYNPDDLIPQNSIQDVVDYCHNDVDATEELYKVSLPQITMRKELSKKFNLDLINANDPKIGEQIMLNRLSKALNIEKRQLRTMRTIRSNILIANIIKSVSFEIAEFNNILEKFTNTVISPDNIKGALNLEFNYKQVNYSLGLGGIHGVGESGIYEADEDWVYINTDVSSYYPNLAIKYKLAPLHLGKVFPQLYEDVYKERQTYPKSNVANYGLKIAINGVYGKSGDINSFLYDPQYMLQITINGQLQMLKLIEMVYNLPDVSIIYANTDGIIVKISRKLYESGAYAKVCNDWETLNNGLVLEHDEVDGIWLRDVNNYIIKESNGKIKSKGIYRIWNELKLHEGHSMNIVAYAVRQYFINNIPIDKTIKEGTNILDYCIHQRTRKHDYFNLIKIVDGKVQYEKIGRYLRYFVTHNHKDAVTLQKIFIESGKKMIFHRGFSIYPLNTVLDIDASDYTINYQFYIAEARKLITPILKTQYTLNW